MSSGIIPAYAYRYENLPNAVKSRSRTVQFTPINGSTFNSTSSNMIKLDIRSTGYLCGQESFLTFSITNNSGGTVFLDGQASSCIQRLRLVANGVVLSDIQNYHILSAFLISAQGSDDYARVLSIVGGYADVPSPSSTLIPVGADAAEILANSGMNGLSAGATKTYSIPLISGLLNSSRFLPLGLMTGALTLEIYLEPNFGVVFNASGAFSGTQTYTVQNVSYIAKIVEIENEASENLIKQMLLTSGLQIKTNDFTCHVNNIPNGAASASLTIPDRSSSLKSLITLLQHSGATYNISGIQSYKFDVTQYNYRVGSNLYPIQPVSCSDSNLTQVFNECLKCFNSGLYSLNTHTNMSFTTFSNDTTYTKFGGFSMAYDFENYSSSENFSGLELSTLGLPVTLQASFTAPVALNVNTFANYDCVYTITPDGLINKVM